MKQYDVKISRAALSDMEQIYDAEILGVLNTENFVVVLAFGRRREEVFQPPDEVARRLPVEPHERGVASRILQLVVVGVASRYSGHELRGVTVAQVEILQFLEKVLIPEGRRQPCAGAADADPEGREHKRCRYFRKL